MCNKIWTVECLKVKNSQKLTDLCEGFKNRMAWCGQASNTSDLLLQQQTKIILQQSSYICKFRSAKFWVIVARNHSLLLPEIIVCCCPKLQSVAAQNFPQ